MSAPGQNSSELHHYTLGAHPHKQARAPPRRHRNQIRLWIMALSWGYLGCSPRVLHILAPRLQVSLAKAWGVSKLTVVATPSQ